MEISEVVGRLVAVVGDAPRPWIVGIAGGVAVGKTTFATALAGALDGDVSVVATDAFLRPNAELEARGLTLRKGFPESYDWAAFERALTALSRGEATEVPVYSHLLYDIDPDATATLEPTPWVLVEGVNALQRPLPYDVRVYLHAEEADARRWFTTRLRESIRGAAPGTFYAAMAGMDDAAVDVFADQVWDGINAVNLHDHIAPTRSTADLVVTLDADHHITGITPP